MLSAGFTAFAIDEAPATTAQVMPVATVVGVEKKMVLEIGPAGRALLRGTVSSVGTNSLIVKSWGGDWIINVSSSTALAPRAADMTQFAVGDFVGVNGVASTAAAWTIDATLVKNWTQRKEIRTEAKEVKEKKMELKEEKKNAGPGTNNEDVQRKIQEILEQIKKIQAQMGAMLLQ